ncbi:type II CAAX prenyl endopeptidase Rce1 family protein [Erythrobacter sp. AP23]|uniref:CPBP family glutamic-type intramembrane protease n=1 Tax=Erythrobacter sp. AP23 TaxID=499656 RepID=UPI0018DC9B10|nr:CPBP family glutamic-type intramembrane protease [Erythrobacter sp. AP23]
MTTMIFGVLALPVILATDLTTGEQLNEALSGSIWSVLLLVVILGPLVEEIIFRGWLSGTWRSALASAFGLTAIYGGSALLDPYLAEGSAIKPLILVTGASAIFFAFSPLDYDRRIIGFDRVFPIIFYAQAVAFGTLHFQNYAASSLVIALFATLPLIACGLIWGYARVRLGLAPAVILHAAYNVPAAIGSIIMVHYAG